VREVIDEILGSEQEAQRLIEEARAAATETRNRAEVEAVRILAAARDDAQSILRERTEKAREEARVAHDARVRKAEEDSRLFLERHEGAIRELVDEVAALILAPEHSRG
jgi:cell division septum initiation protein DivIVA